MIEKVLKEGKLEFIIIEKAMSKKCKIILKEYATESWVHVNRNEYCDKEDYHVKISIQHRGKSILAFKRCGIWRTMGFGIQML